MLTLEFQFRIKGTFYYSANHLIENHILVKNQQLKIKPDSQNPYDNHALTLWLPFANLPKSIQNHQTLEHEKWLLNWVHLHYLYRLPTKLSLKLSTHLSTTNAPQIQLNSLTPNQVIFRHLRWRFIPHQWLIGYLPRALAKPLHTVISDGNDLPQISIKVSQIESASKVFAKMHLRLSIIKTFIIFLKLIKSGRHKDFSWRLKFFS